MSPQKALDFFLRRIVSSASGIVPPQGLFHSKHAMSSPRAVSSRQRKAAVQDTETRAQSESKRRKIRKGTHSCWECKRRKMKCIVDPLSNGSCNSCRRRGSKCVSQEFSEEASPHLDKTQMGDRVVRVETLVDQLIQQTGGDGTPSDRRTPMTPSEDGRRTDSVLLTPASIDSEPLPFLAFYKSSKVRIRDSGMPCLSLTA